MALYRLSLNGANLEYFIDNALQFSSPLAGVTSHTINAGATNDTLQIVGLISLPGGITFNGGAQSGPPGDTLVVQAGTVSSATVSFTNASNGSVVLTSGAISATYNFTGLEPVDMTGTTAADQVFNLPGGTNAQLEDDGTAGNNISQIRDVLGGFETTTFTHPTNSLTINGGATADNLNINLADTLGGVALTINVAGTTTFTNLGSPSTPLASVTTNALGTTLINTSAITTTGAQIYNDAVTLGTDTALTSTGAGAIAFNSTVDGAQTLTASTGGTVTFGAAVGGGTALTALGISASTVSFNGINNVGTLAANLTGGGLTYTDADALDIGTAGTVSGISAASLALTTGGNITQSAGSVTVGGATTLDAGGTNDITLSNAANNFGTVSVASGNNVTLVDLNAIDLGTSTVSGNLTVNASGAITDSGLLSVNGATALTAGSGNNITLDNAGNNFGTVSVASGNNVTLVDLNAIDLGNSTVSGNLTVNANGAITDSGLLLVTGTATLAAGVGNDITLNNASNDFGGAVMILAAKDVTLQDANAIALAATTVQSLSVTAATNITLGNLDTTTGLTVNAGNATTASGTISGAGGLTQAGGVTTLSAINSYTGATTINAGTLLVNGSIASSALTTVSAGTLGGTNGTVGAVNIASGGTLSPGASAGILTANGAVTFTAGANFNVEIGGTTAGVDYDRLVAGASVALAGATLNASLLGSPVVGTEYKIIDKVSAGAVSGTFDGIANGSTVTIGGQAFQINYAGGDGNDVTLSLGALKISGTDPDPIVVLADVNTTTIAGVNLASPSQSAVRDQVLNGDISGTVNAGVTVNGFGLGVSSSKAGGAVNFVNNGAIVIDNAGANGIAALFLSGNGGGVTYSGTGTISNHADTPDSTGLSIASNGGIGGTNLVEVAGSITGSRGIDTADGTTTIVVTGTVTGTGGTAIFFNDASSNNTVDLKPTAVITGNLDGSGNDDTVRLSGTSGSGSFDLSKIGSDFSTLTKVDGSTWTVTGTFADPNAATIVVNGTLLVNGTIGGGVTVGTSFTDTLPVPPPVLGGTGTVGNVLVQDHGILTPGASAGTLTVTGNLTMAGGSTLGIEIGGAGAGQFDVLNVNGTAPGTGAIELGGSTLTGSFIGGFTPSLGQVFKIIDNAGSDAIGSPFNGISEGAGVNFGGQTFTVSYIGGDGNDVTLTAVANGAPGLTGFGPSLRVTSSGPAATPVLLDGNVSFTDVEGNFNGGTLTLTGLLAEDTVSVQQLGFDPGQFLLFGNQLLFEGNVIGTVSGGNGTTFSVTFNNSATSTAINDLIENLTYVDSSNTPTFSRTLTLTVKDDQNASTGAKPIEVQFNVAPVAQTGSASGNEDTAINSAVVATDANSDTLSYSLVGANGGAQHGTVALNSDGSFTYTPVGNFNGTDSFSFIANDGILNSNTGTENITVNAVNDPPVNTVPGAQTVDANSTLAISGLSIADVDAASGTVTGTLSVAHGTLTVASAGGAGVSGSGTASVTLSGTVAQINATLAANNVVYTGAHDFFGTDALTVHTSDGGHTGSGGALTDTDTVAISVGTLVTGTAGDNSFTALPGNERIDAGLGTDTITFDFKLIDATVSYLGNTTIIDGPSGSHTVLTGVEVFNFTDGTVHNDDGSPLVDDLFYYSRYHDVWNADVDADAHYNQFGWHEGRDPDAFFSTNVYLSANPDVNAAGVNPLTHFDSFGWKEGRVPSIDFDPRQYLNANPDVKAASIDPLAHFLQFGAGEGRQPFKPTELVTANGFDYVYYLQHNPDVAAAHVDPFQHYETIGWKEGRNPNALFDDSGYLANYPDVKNAGINPLDHYNQFGWHEGRDPSPGFDTSSYLAAYADVNAAHINPLTHFLQFGIHEGRSPFADGVWG